MATVQQRALVIGEHPAIRRLLRLNLSDLPLDVREANTAQARDRVGWELPNVVVIDLHPPFDYSLALCHYLRWNSTTAMIPAVLLVNGGDEEVKVLAGKAGATVCMDKPFRAQQLRDAIQSLLDSSSRHAAVAESPGDGSSSGRYSSEDEARLAGARLAARTAHHLLNTPLTLALGFAELIAEDPRLPAELGSMVKEVAGNISTAASILQRLQLIDRLDERESHVSGGPILDLAAAEHQSI
jgi:DNA-binding response OmpR family regulator